jgi:hypothetical protein
LLLESSGDLGEECLISLGLVVVSLLGLLDLSQSCIFSSLFLLQVGLGETGINSLLGGLDLTDYLLLSSNVGSHGLLLAFIRFSLDGGFECTDLGLKILKFFSGFGDTFLECAVFSVLGFLSKSGLFKLGILLLVRVFLVECCLSSFLGLLDGLELLLEECDEFIPLLDAVFITFFGVSYSLFVVGELALDFIFSLCLSFELGFSLVESIGLSLFLSGLLGSLNILLSLFSSFLGLSVHDGLQCSNLLFLPVDEGEVLISQVTDLGQDLQLGVLFKG